MYNNYIPNHANISNYNVSDEYVENYLKGKIGKEVLVYASFPDSIEWRDKCFKGILENVGKDYLTISIDNTQNIIWCIYINYIIVK